jgi:membrane dipeptidase
MIPIFDGHNDTLLHYYKKPRGEKNSFFEETKEGHIDYPRAKKAGFAGGFFAIYSPDEGFDLEAHLKETEEGYEFLLSPPRDRQFALQDVIAMAKILYQTERESEGKFKVVRTSQELKDCLEQGVMAAIFHIEGAEALDTKLDTLELLYQAGLRSLGPVWSRQNAFGSGVPFSFPKHPDTGDGLPQAGKDLVKKCNELNIMIDLSHMTEKGFWDVAALSNAPLVATHSNVYALSHSARNLTDKQLEAIAESDGMVGLNFAVSFLRPDGKPDVNTPLELMAQHLDYMIDKVGENRVGFGSDFDGARIPKAIKDVTGLPKLLKALKKHGYNQELLEKIAYKNWVRVLELTWA